VTDDRGPRIRPRRARRDHGRGRRAWLAGRSDGGCVQYRRAVGRAGAGFGPRSSHCARSRGALWRRDPVRALPARRIEGHTDAAQREEFKSQEHAMKPLVGVIAPGAMGSAVAKRLVENGLKVLTVLEGRSAETLKRAAAAGMTDAGLAEI